MRDSLPIIEADIQSVQQAQTQMDSEQIDRAVQSLVKHLLEKDNYKRLGDERILSTAFRLLDQEFGAEIKDRLNSLSQWLEIVRDVNNKFYAILDHEIELDELLFSHLPTWKVLADDIICSFDNETKQRLVKIRDSSGAEQKIQSFISIYIECAKQQNQDRDLSELEELVELVLKSLKRLSQWNVQALFSLGSNGGVYGITISSTPSGTGSIKSNNEIDIEMRTAAKRAYELVKNKYLTGKNWDITWDIERGDIPYSGNSIGLALSLGILSTIERLEIDPYTAFTGHVIWNTGKVEAVSDMDKKLEAAKQLGIRRVFIPLGNDDQEIPGLKIIPVSSVDETKVKLAVKTYISSNSDFQKQAELKLTELEFTLALKGVKVVGNIENGDNFKRLQFTDFHDQVFVNMYFGKNGLSPIVQQKSCLLRDLIHKACDQIFEKSINQTTNDTKRSKYLVSDHVVQDRIQNHILSLPFSAREVEKNCLYRAKISNNGQTVFIRQFNNGKLTIDGREPLFSEINNQIQDLLGYSALSQDPSEKKLEEQIEAVKAINLGNQWIGTDEAGKGDYFGPLVGAAVLLDSNLADRLSKIGVKDSKQLSDKRNIELASKIINICGKRAQVVLVPPARYNQLYKQFKQEGKNLNTLLAWVHTRALDDLLSIFPQDQITVIIDKFADEEYIKNKLLENARRTNLNLVQLPKAEANLAVAAASILARAQFLNWLEKTSQQYHLSLPKGSSNPKISQIARQIIENYGQEKLAEIAKLHFKTTKDIMH